MGGKSSAVPPALPEGRVHHGDPALRGLAAAEAPIPMTVVLLARSTSSSNERLLQPRRNWGETPGGDNAWSGYAKSI